MWNEVVSRWKISPFKANRAYCTKSWMLKSISMQFVMDEIGTKYILLITKYHLSQEFNWEPVWLHVNIWMLINSTFKKSKPVIQLQYETTLLIIVWKIYRNNHLKISVYNSHELILKFYLLFLTVDSSFGKCWDSRCFLKLCIWSTPHLYFVTIVIVNQTRHYKRCYCN